MSNLNGYDSSDLSNLNDIAINKLFSDFGKLFYTMFNVSFPSLPISCKVSNKRSLNPWMTSELINACKKKSKLYKIYRRYKNTVARTKYKLFAKQLKIILLNAEAKFHAEEFCKSKNNVRQTWRNINNLLKKTNINNFQGSFKIDDHKVTDKKIIADAFNTQYTSVGIKLSNSIINREGTIFDAMGPTVLNSICFTPTDSFEIQTIIKNLPNTSSAGPDEIPTCVIKAASPYIRNILAHLINLIMETGVFPDSMKQARVVPIYKSGEKDLVANYRPISILNTFSKIIEKVILTRLSNFFETHNILSNKQFGFRARHSTYMPLVLFIDKISQNKEKSRVSIAVYLDLMKAFDTINHQILLKKLNHYGIRGLPLSLIDNYLKNRSQYVIFDNVMSDTLPITTGVPQGSILGPLLFLIYINDFVNVSKIGDVFLFADDTNALYSGCNIENLIHDVNADLSLISRWCDINKLSINKNKTKAMIFGVHAKETVIHDIMIDGVKIEFVTQCTFLGVEIDSKLTWKKHVQKLCTNISSVIGVIYRIRDKINTKTAWMIYDALIASQLNYCNIVWGCGYKTDLDSLYVLQKRAWRLCLRLPRRTDTQLLLIKSNRPSVYDLNNILVTNFVYSAINKILPSIFDTFFTLTRNIHTHDSRRKSNLQTVLATSNVRKFSLAVRGVSLWNSLPDDVKESPSLAQFKRTYRESLSCIITTD